MVSSNGYSNGIVQQTEESASGTGNLNLVSLSQFRDLNDEYSTGGSDVFKYFIRDKSTGEQEFGTGHLVDLSTLARDTVLWSTNSNNLVDFGSGVKLITQEPAVNSSGDFVFGSSQFQGDISDDQGNTIYDYSNQTIGDGLVDVGAASFTDQQLGTGDSPMFDGGTFSSRLDVNADLRLTTDHAIEDGGGNERINLSSIQTELNYTDGTAAIHLDDGNTNSLQLDIQSGMEFRIRDEEGEFKAVTYTTAASAPGTLKLTNATLDANSQDILNAGKVQFSDVDGDGNQWEIKERDSGFAALDLNYGGTDAYSFRTPSDNLGINASSTHTWKANTGTTAVINSNNNLVQDSGSSRRFKSEIEPANITMNQIMQIEPKHFYHEQTERMEYGLIAEEVHEIGGFEQYVTEDSEGRISGLRYGRMVTLCISAIKDLQQQVNELEA